MEYIYCPYGPMVDTRHTAHTNKHIAVINSYPSHMAKCQKHASIQLFWLLSMVLLVSSVVRARIINGQKDINTNVTMTTVSSTSNIIGTDGELTRGICFLEFGYFWCEHPVHRFKKLEDCLAHCKWWSV